jgi:hypothetical protein
MDGLTVFLEILKNMKENSSLSGWSQLDSVVNPTAAKVKKTPVSSVQLDKWNELPLEQRRAGFIVAFANCKKENKENDFLKHLQIDPNSTDADLIFKYHSLFPFNGANVEQDDVEIEKQFLFQFEQSLFAKFYRNSQVFGWSDTMIEYQNNKYNVKDLAMVKYVTSQYDLCNDTNALTYKSMPDEADFDARLEKAIKGKNDTIVEFDDAQQGFAQYKIYQLPVDQYEEVGKNELLVNGKKQMEELLDKRLLSYANVHNPNYLVANSIFWKQCAPKWFNDIFDALDGNTLGILLLLDAERKKPSTEDSVFLTQFFNCFEHLDIKTLSVDDLVPFLKKFPPTAIKDLSKEEINREIALFEKFQDYGDKYKEPVRILQECVNDDTKTPDEITSAAKQLPFLSTSYFYLKNAPNPQKKKEEKEEKGEKEEKEEKDKTPNPSGSTSTSSEKITPQKIDAILLKFSQQKNTFNFEEQKVLFGKIQKLFSLFKFYALGLKKPTSKIATQHLNTTLPKLRKIMNLLMTNIEEKGNFKDIKSIYDTVYTIARNVVIPCNDLECTSELSIFESLIKTYEKTQSNYKDPGESQFSSTCMKDVDVAEEIISQMTTIQFQIDSNYQKETKIEFIRAINDCWRTAKSISSTCQDNKKLFEITDQISKSFTSCAISFLQSNYQQDKSEYEKLIQNEAQAMQSFTCVLQNDINLCA